jgi:hypothetical protein
MEKTKDSADGSLCNSWVWWLPIATEVSFCSCQAQAMPKRDHDKKIDIRVPCQYRCEVVLKRQQSGANVARLSLLETARRILLSNFTRYAEYDYPDQVVKCRCDRQLLDKLRVSERVCHGRLASGVAFCSISSH